MFLRVNRNVKREWRIIHRAFGGIGLFSFAIEHTISMINMFIQHYGAGTTLAKKFTVLLKALQLELGCTGNPLWENFDEKDLLATECWVKSFWERLYHYPFEIHLIYPSLVMPCQHDHLLVEMFLVAGYKGLQLQGLNRCRLALRLLFLLNITTACGRFLDVTFLADPNCSQNHCSTFIFPNEKPSQSKWKTWLEFWTAVAGPGGSLNQPLGEWVGLTHRKWTSFYRPRKDIMYRRQDDRIETYTRSATGRVRSGQTYRRSHIVGNLPQPALTAMVLELPDGLAICREIGPPLFVPEETNPTFWELLRSLSGEWMWEHVKDENSDMSWVWDAMVNGMLLAVTDGLYDRERAKDVSGSRWILLCTASRQTLHGIFYEISPKARSFRGELLGLVAIHTLALAVVQFFHLDCVSGKNCCDNIAALNQSSKVCQWV